MKVQELINAQIQERVAQISCLQHEIEKLEKKLEENKDKTGIEKWLGYNFESSSSRTPEYSAFEREFKKELVKQLPENCELVNWSRGHFEVSCFIKNAISGRFAYLSTSDVRYFPDEWYNNLLIRTAKHEKDYTGGSNDSSDWKNLKKNLERLFKFANI
jgi:hypothetical protein